MLKISRTIADLAGEKCIQVSHLARSATVPPALMV
ncbi:MAG: hypothetical protein IT329_22055 [Caldilineaceae bacterium]|nr:hypothetical protein [Caldilineaceae bacterium]